MCICSDCFDALRPTMQTRACASASSYFVLSLSPCHRIGHGLFSARGIESQCICEDCFSALLRAARVSINACPA